MASKKYLEQLKNLGSSRAVLIRYSTSKLSDSQRVLLHYKLKGRGSNKGLLEKTGSTSIAKSVILAPEGTSQEILSFLRESNCKFKIKHLIINPSKLVELSNLALRFKKKYSSILDIRLIESDGKRQVCIIAHAENLPSISRELASKVKLPVIHIQASQLLAPDSKLLETIRAGTSLLKEVPALPTKKLFVYSTKHLTGVKKVKFHYELRGRDKEGIIAQTQSEFFAKSIIIAPDSKADVIRRFLQKYSCEFVELEVAEISHGY